MKATSEKVVSYMRAEMRATAEAKGRRGDIAEAMVDATIEVKGISEKDKLLTLTSDDAKKFGIADAITKDYEAAVALLNLGESTRSQNDTHWGEKIARFLTDPTVSSLLMSFGFLGLLIEFYTPGFGVAGAIGIACLLLFFLGQYAAQLAGHEELLIFVVGLLLLAVEVLVIPGFGFVGLAGMIAIGVAVAMALVELEIPYEVASDLGYVQEAAQVIALNLSILVILLVAGAMLGAKYLPGSPFARVITNAYALPKGGTKPASAKSTGASVNLSAVQVGQRGDVLTVLRPTGTAQIDGHKVHVVSDGEFIDEGRAGRSDVG